MSHIRPHAAFWLFLLRYDWVPGLIGIALAVAGLCEPRRKREASQWAIVLMICVYFIMYPLFVPKS